MILTLIHGHSCMRNQKLYVPFLGNLTVDLDEIQYVATTCWFVDDYAFFFFFFFLRGGGGGGGGGSK